MAISKVPLSVVVIAWTALVSSATDMAAQVSDGVVKIGVLTDMTGFLSDIAGPGAVLAVRMAVSDFGGEVLRRRGRRQRQQGGCRRESCAKLVRYPERRHDH